MKIKATGIADLVVLEPKIWEDHRGYFFESFSAKSWGQLGLANEGFVQDNEAKSNKGVLRGLHYQLPPYAQSKLVRVIKGAVLDVAVDIREGSATYGQHYSIILSEENKQQLYVPRGFAHGYLVLRDDTIFAYKCDNFYTPDSEGGILWSDPTLAIEWALSPDEIIVSDKDKILPRFGEHLTFSF